ncbi:hypothetical protein ACPWT1_02965 [Ramlibacter sp. MMS24-I3-19]|uniref:hypothetical protein n=1 Tax=Ramlibacter sp. MMS24-I3-19 TaxID=3416606 RepID=UPI003D04ED2C
MLDLDDVKSGKQRDLSIEEVAAWPADFAHLMAHPETKEPFNHGTLVVWRKIDRLRFGGHYGTGLKERMQDLTKFIARAYRRFIDKGLYIELDDREITLHDPLFLLSNPRVVKKFGEDLRAKIVDEGHFTVDGHSVNWRVSLLPEEVRRKRGEGGRAGKGREDFEDLYIPDNVGRISMLRNDREIYYDVVPRLLPNGVDKVDRFIGIEISFPAELDEYFQVRNVKRGAEPVSKLREELKKALKKPVDEARKEVRRYWGEVEQKEALATGDAHMGAHEAVDNFDRTAPKGQAGFDGTDQATVDETLQQLFQDLGLDPGKEDDKAKAEWIRESFDSRALTVVDAA